MADTVRTPTTLLTENFVDGQVAGISAQDMRDLIVSLRNPHGEVYVSTPAETTIAASGTYVKGAGTFTTGGVYLMDDAGGANNRLRYTGPVARRFHVAFEASLTFASGTNQVAGIQLYKYDASASSGALLVGSQARSIVASTDIAHIISTENVELDTNDYLEIWIANHTNTNNMTMQYGNITAFGMF